ncbi:hypothetical protein [Schaalia sp. lx-100]|uniref:hypothetical protein n=1 Tax=Schaalia sp. lx-100 TaxID=2899081 RepID=UPI001E4C2352|nr:hypothetical protein [Schaalia sp. lx-100]MCD4556701.1 hypothetical protein [Schaalia sp. lx-100]
MSRRSSKRRWSERHRELDLSRIAGIRHSEMGPGGVLYQVQQVAASQKSYICPGCSGTVLGVPHIVAWPEEASWGHEYGPQSRRHWHSECWRRRLRPQ